MLWGCCWIAILWVIWIDRYRGIFDKNKGVGVEGLWKRVRFWSSLWPSVSSEFQEFSC